MVFMTYIQWLNEVPMWEWLIVPMVMGYFYGILFHHMTPRTAAGPGEDANWKDDWPSFPGSDMIMLEIYIVHNLWVHL